MGWLHALACFLPPSPAPGERFKDKEGKDKDGEGEGGGSDEAVGASVRGRGIVNGMAPFTRSKTQQKQQQREEDEKAEQRNWGTKAVEKEKDRSKGRNSKRQRVKEEAGGVCGMCQEPVGNEAFVASCGHQFCRPCVVEHFSKIIRHQTQDANPKLETVASCSQCPNTSCTEEFRRFELVDLVGSKEVRLYERWLASVYQRLFTPLVDIIPSKESRMLCWNTECDKQNPSAILSSTLMFLPLSEVHQAAEVRELPHKYVRDVCIQNILYSVGRSKREQNKALWLCTTCDHTWCAYCGFLMPLMRKKSDRQNVHTECSGQQRFKVYQSMMQLDDACKSYSASHQVTPERERKASTGIKTIWANGTGFGGETESKNVNNMQMEAKVKEQINDAKVAKNFRYLTSVLKKEKEGGGQFSSLLTATCAILGWKNILNRLLRQLAANDSMLDIAERSFVYISMVDLLKEFADLQHKDLDCIVLGCNHSDNSEREIVVLDKRTSILKVEDELCTIDKDNSVIKKLENIYKQAKVMIQRIQTTGSTDGDTQGDMALAKELCACYEMLEESILKRTRQATELAPETPAPRRATRSNDKMQEAEEEDTRGKQHVINYKEKLRPLQFKEVVMADENGHYRHHYKDYIGGKTSQSTSIDKRGIHNQRRMLRMAKEISSLSTTLPLEWESSIHLYVDQNRLDVLRAVIIGPNGTPYQNGIFQFDVFLPPDYPEVPPHVHFLTTGGRKVRFNPNLYDSGKICLSLLGTWNGPGWIPGKSTLLQVLVSIQSLIFVKDPYYNEPGYEQKESPEAEKENARHREHTLSLAVLAPLKKADPLFSELIAEHFRHKREEVEQQCDQWLALATDSAMQQRMTSTVNAIKAELVTLSS